MVNRVLLGQNSNGEEGLWVSKPGIDVIGAGLFDYQFSPDYAHLRLIAAGQTSIGPNGEDNGENVANVSYDKSYSSPLPLVIALAMSGDWTLGLHTNSGGGQLRQGTLAQYGYLNNQWHTHVLETIRGNIAAGSFVYSPSGATQVGYPGSSANIIVPGGWASIKFETRVYNSYCQFAACNTYNTVWVRYLIFDPTTG